MEILNLGGLNEPSERPSKKKLKVVIGIGVLAGVMGLGSTLAASITLNGGTSVEFGQGVQLVAACDSAITVTPTSTFVNDPLSAESNFRLSTIVLSGISTGCLGKKLRITGYTSTETGTVYTVAGNSIASPLAFARNYLVTGEKFLPAAGNLPLMAGCEITVHATNVESSTAISCAGNGGTDDTTARTLTASGSGSAGILTITFTTGTTANNIAQPSLAAAFDKFALESSA
ncbi:hypothetical protein MCEGKSE7_01039 [Candidatus Nanopelagicaceae bacterium]